MKNALWYHVTTAGAVGGLLGWFIAATFPGYFDGAVIVYLEVPKFILGGAVAAMAGVYLVANTDTTNFARTAGFAAVCGLAWPAVLSTASTLVLTTAQNRDLAKTGEEVEAKTEALQTQPTPAKVDALTTATLETASKLTASASPEVKETAVKKADEAVTQLSALKATVVNDPALRESLTRSLHTLSNQSNLPPSIRNRAAAALESMQATLPPQGGNAAPP